MWWLLWIGTSWAASPWIDVDPDLHAQTEVPADPQAITAFLSDPRQVSELFDEDCTRRWAFGVPASGPGARARVTWVPSWLHRRLTVVVSEVVEGRRVVLDHEGPKGFLVVFDVTGPPAPAVETSGGVEVSEAPGVSEAVPPAQGDGAVDPPRSTASEPSTVSVHVPLQPPPWPVRELFHTKVKPAWTQCFERALARLSVEVD